MRGFLHLTPVLLLAGHALAQAALSLPDETWRPWVQVHAPSAVAGLTVALLALRLTVDLGLCVWALGRHRIARALPEPLRRA
jgi:hypothetical protein